ncbi:MAG: hypoxanthine phosphoribosyltransferase [Planctomycetes bacterium]|nr:hypoxanthine phosphoribosyltransferase [Planctomycetota bacterium]
MTIMRIPVLISSARIQDKIKQLARRISHDYRKRPPLMICVLNGAFVFMADLIRQLTIPAKQHPVGAESSGIECDFIRLSSYGKTTKSSGKIKVVMDIECPVRGKNIIIVEDIIDTGLTAGFLVNRLKQAKARSIRICALLDKPARRMEPIKIDYPGFTVPNKFVVGYGLDYKEQYRQLPYIGYIPD